MISSIFRGVAVLAVVAQVGTAIASTQVRVNTTMGSFDLLLLEEVAPVSVANFLQYVQSGRYENTLIHRSVPNFVIQGGGYYNLNTPVETFAPIVNEPHYDNVRGSIGVARYVDMPDSGTSQWYINTADNSAMLDQFQWTVFGYVMGDGMAVVDAINALPTQTVDFMSDVPTVDVRLSMSVVPEPNSAWQLLAGLTGLLGLWQLRSRTALGKAASARH